ncbi:T-cell differentiation antigen CD6 [Lissotriton helveticus]
MPLVGKAWGLLLVTAAFVAGKGTTQRDKDVSPTARQSVSTTSDWTGVTKAEPSLRLVNGTGRCVGSVEIRLEDHWIPLCQEPWDWITADVLCRKLDCGSAFGWMGGHDEDPSPSTRSAGNERHRGPAAASNQTVPHSMWVVCAHLQRGLENCSVSPKPCPSERPAELNCTAQHAVRLVDGPSPCAGRVEVEHHGGGSWGTVCDDSWDLSDGHVVCRQLGCGSAINVFGEARFGMGDGPIHLDEVNCTGLEASLWDCPAAPKTDCGHKEDASVVCSDALGLMPTTPAVTEETSPITAREAMMVTGVVRVTSSDALSSKAHSLLIACIFLALMLFATLLLCGLIIFRMNRKHSMSSQDRREASLVRQGTPVLVNHSPQAPTLPPALPSTEPRSVHPPSRTAPPKAQAPAHGTDSDSDYEDYDFSTKPPMAVSSFYNSLRYRPIEETPQQVTIQMATLEEVPDSSSIQRCRTQGDTNSMSSDEDYGNSGPIRKNGTKPIIYPAAPAVPPAPSNHSYAQKLRPSPGT